MHVYARHDAVTDKHRLRIERRHHGNAKVSVIDADFVHGADYAALSSTARFRGMIGPGARAIRGRGDKKKQAAAERSTAALRRQQGGVKRG